MKSLKFLSVLLVALSAVKAHAEYDVSEFEKLCKQTNLPSEVSRTLKAIRENISFDQFGFFDIDRQVLGCEGVAKVLSKTDKIVFRDHAGTFLPPVTTAGDLSVLQTLPHLTDIAINLSHFGSGFSSGRIDLRPLSKLTKIKRLSATAAQVYGLVDVLESNQLEYLATNALALPHLQEQKSLSELHVWNVTSQSIVMVLSAPQLKKLVASSNDRNQVLDIFWRRSHSSIEELSLWQINWNVNSTAKHLESLKKLKVTSSKVNGLNYLPTSLKDIEMTSVITDYSQISHLSGLERLTAKRGKIEEVRFVQHLENLQSLDLSENEIRDSTGIRNLQHLERLNLSRNPLSLSLDLNTLREVKELNISHTNFGLLYRIKGYQNLEVLDAISANINGIEPLKELKSLKVAKLSYNRIRDISPLENLPLEEIEIAGNRIRTLQPLASIKTLKNESLNVSDNRLISLEGIEGMTQLKNLDAGENNILDIKPLANLIHLERIDLELNHVRTIHEVMDFENLKSLRLFSNPIEDESQLEALKERGVRVYF